MAFGMHSKCSSKNECAGLLIIKPVNICIRIWLAYLHFSNTTKDFFFIATQKSALSQLLNQPDNIFFCFSCDSLSPSELNFYSHTEMQISLLEKQGEKKNKINMMQHCHHCHLSSTCKAAKARLPRLSQPYGPQPHK